MTRRNATNPENAEATLRHRLQEYERRFRLLDEQIRVLERERQKFSAVVHHTDAGFLVVDSSLQIAWTNSIFPERFLSSALRGGGVLGQPCNRVLCGRESICDHCPAALPFRTRTVAHHEMSLQIEGKTLLVYATGMPIKSLSGQIEQCMVMLQDVTDLEALRNSQEALKASEEQFRSIFENAAVGMTTRDPGGRFLRVNPAFCRFLGYSEAELLTRNVQEVTHPEDRPATRKIITAGEGGTLDVLEIEKRYLRKDGTVAWGHATITWLKDSRGRPLYSIGLIQDIGERKHAEAALRESETRKGAILDTALDAVITMDHEGRVTEFNPAAEKLFGYPREEAIGRSLADLVIPPGMRAAHRRGLAHYLKTGKSLLVGRLLQITAMRRDGTEFPVELSITRIPVEGPPVFTGFIRDITERRRAEETMRRQEDQLRHSQKMEAIGTLAGGVAHDFNNLLTGILGYAELLKMNARPGEKVYDSADIIEKAASRAASLTQQLLGFARRGKNQNVVVDLHASIQEVIRLLGRTLEKSIVLKQELADEAATVRGDPAQMSQVVLNLAVNAADAMRQGGELTFRTEIAELSAEQLRRHETAAPGPHVVLSVTDTGSGIPADILPRIFEPFFTTKDQGKGTGMGLAMVYGIVQNHGGFIEVESEVGRGSTFRIALPRAAGSQASDRVDLPIGESDADNSESPAAAAGRKRARRG